MKIVSDCMFLWEKISTRSFAPHFHLSSPSLSSSHPHSPHQTNSYKSSSLPPPTSSPSSSSSFTRLRVCHFNANSIRAHIEQVRLFLSSRPPFHVIGVTETKLAVAVDDSLVSLCDYNLFRHDRNTAGGGVALYVHSSLSATRSCSSSMVWTPASSYPEYLFCEVKPRGGLPMLAGVVYRPPHAPFLKGTDFVSKLTTLVNDYPSKVIVGDFNADQLSVSDVVACFVRSLLRENLLYSVPYGATHHTATSDTWLDLCVVDARDVVADFWKTECPFVDGHDLITATIDIPVPVPPKPVFTFRSFRAVDSTELEAYLAACDWSVLSDASSSLDEALGCLYDNLGLAMDRFAPVQVFEFGKGKHPWFTSEIRKLVGDRERLYRRYRRTRSCFDLFRYREARDVAHGAVEGARLDFYYDRLEGLTDPREIWKELRHLGVAPSPEADLAGFTVDELNAHFASVSFDIDSPLPSDFLSTLESSPDTALAFHFREVTPLEVSEAIRLSRSQAVGVDGVPQKFIDLASDQLSPLLCSIFNRSLTTSYFPSLWRQSTIIALNKVRPPLSPGDFRPISLLCFLSKVLERLVFNQLLDYFETNRLLDEFQSGYRADCSTQTTLLKLTEDIRTGLDRKHLTALLLFDFSKAFDSVCHNTLLRKLHGLGLSIPVLRWISSYLSGRTQVVRDHAGALSQALPTNRGVPQGSVLGPLLFLVYIGDVAVGLDRDVRYLVYADDLQIYLQCPSGDISATLGRLGDNAARVVDWATANHLNLNLGKTKAIVFSSAYYADSFANLTVQVADRVLPLESSVRNLGVIMDARLHWGEHVESVCRKANSLMYRLNHFRKSTNFSLRRHLIQSLLFPLVDYCSLVFCNLSSELNLKLERVINTGIRYIYGVRRCDHISPYRRELGWLRVATRRQYFSCCSLYKLLKCGRPSYLANFFLERANHQPPRGDRARTLVIPKWNTEFLRKSFHVSTSSLWSSLPLSITQSSTITSFKTRLHNHLFALERV